MYIYYIVFQGAGKFDGSYDVVFFEEGTENLIGSSSEWSVLYRGKIDLKLKLCDLEEELGKNLKVKNLRAIIDKANKECKLDLSELEKIS